MNLHDQPVVEAHLRHFGEHLGAEEALVFFSGPHASDAIEQAGGFGGAEVCRLGGQMPVV